ncbi:MAG: DnaJ domain-containing protein [Methanoregula sp.]|nr:MAG: DnaJ domain-containing protein [Methanoregula sp.]
MPIITYYHILGVKDTATRGEIAAAYRKKIKQWHPDVCRHPDAEEKMRGVNEAAEVLLDMDRRKEYDISLARELSWLEKAKSWAREERQRSAHTGEPVQDDPLAEHARRQKPYAHTDPWISPGTARFAAGFCAAAFIFLVLAAGIFSAIASLNPPGNTSVPAPGTSQVNPEVAPSGAQLTIEEGDELFAAGDYEGALRMYDAVIARDPGIPDKDVWYNRGMAQNILGRYHDASSSFDHVLALAPSDSLAMGQKGTALLGLGKYEDALDYTDRALSGNSDIAWIWNNRGIALSRLGQQKEARAAFDNAMVVTTARTGY